MRTELCLMPAKCTKCGELFDLSYDLERRSNERLANEVLRTRGGRNAVLCWDCRELA